MTIVGQLQGVILNRAAKFLRQRRIGAFLESAALVLDDSVDAAARGLALSNPLRCDPVSLPALSKDRKIRLYATEPDSSKRFRLAHWRQIRRHFGSAYGRMINIQPFFLGADGKGTLPWIRIVSQIGDGSVAIWRTLAPDGTYSEFIANPSNWNYDGQPAKWSREWCIIHLPAGYSTAIHYDDGHSYDDGSIYDGVSTAAIADLVAGLMDAGAPHTRLAGLILTDLQPTDSIPSAFGLHPFDPNSVATSVDGNSTTLPTGNWGSRVYTSGPHLGLATRPSWADWVYEDNP